MLHSSSPSALAATSTTAPGWLRYCFTNSTADKCVCACEGNGVGGWVARGRDALVCARFFQNLSTPSAEAVMKNSELVATCGGRGVSGGAWLPRPAPLRARHVCHRLPVRERPLVHLRARQVRQVQRLVGGGQGALAGEAASGDGRGV